MQMFRYKLMIYDTLAGYYDALVKDEEASLAWLKWIQSKSEPCEVLELACGSGEITELLSKSGYQVSALDLSEQMIEQARTKDKDHKIQFYCQDMRDLSGFPSYSLILCLCDSFNYLLTEEEVSNFFKEVADHLKLGGYFLFDTHSLDRLDEFRQEYNETGSFEDCDYQWSITSEEDLIYQDFAFYLADDRVVQEHHIQRVYDPEFLKSELSKHFEIIKVTTDFDQDGICEGEKYFYICKKRES